MATAGPLPRWVDLGLLPLLNLLAAFFVTGLIVWGLGESPWEALRLMVYGAFGYGSAVGYTLFYATNFVFTGLAFAIAFHAALFNIGAEGQAYLGGLGVGLVCLAFDAYLPFVLILPLAILGAALFGAAWGAVPGWLQAHRGAHVVITTIMFNFIAAALMTYLLVDVLINPGQATPETRRFAEAAQMPRLHEIGAALGLPLARSPLNLAFFVALLAALGVWLLLWKTRFGYALRVTGQSEAAAVYAGIDPRRITILAMALSGALAGMMALNEIMGAQQRLLLGFTGGFGFVGIAVALMGRNHPFGIVMAAILFGALYQGGSELAFDMPTISRDMVVVIQGLVILFAGALENMFRPSLARLFARPQRHREA
ncbi:MAG: ABC transporter permease [Pseudomonadota bacterium]